MRVARTLGSSIGAKWLMALTGLALVGFVIAHMLGNLQVFSGREKLNAYAEALQNLGPLLWAMRLGLLTIFVVHIASAFKVWRTNKAARPVPYATLEPQVTSMAARTMMLSGLVVLAFTLYHLAHFTFGWTNPEHFALTEPVARAADPLRRDVYAMVVSGFQVPFVSIVYVIAQAILALHISHGASSAFQTFGVTHPLLRPLFAKLGPALAVVVFVGNCSIPVAILAGAVKP
jgi:succinate dehydrogenase / fumarate reductase cytochrome b subunit